MAKPTISTKKHDQGPPVDPTTGIPDRKPAAARGGKKKPSIWKRYAEQLFRAEQIDRKITAAAAASQVANTNAEHGKLLQALAKSGGRADTMRALHALDAAQVPAVKAPPPPKFAVGDKVFVAKKFLHVYTKTGIYAADELAALEVVRIATNGKSFLCETHDGVAVRVLTYKHLVKTAVA
jgi:hypothetical protein